MKEANTIQNPAEPVRCVQRCEEAHAPDPVSVCWFTPGSFSIRCLTPEYSAMSRPRVARVSSAETNVMRAASNATFAFVKRESSSATNVNPAAMYLW